MKTNLEWTSAFLVLCLCLIAATVAIMVALQISAWKMIVVYWLVLTAKNAVDYANTFRRL